MRNWKLLPAIIAATLAAAIVLYVAFYFVFLDFFVDLWWFRSLEFEAYFWLKLLYRFIFSGAVTAFFFVVFLFHFWIASRYLGLNPPDETLMDDSKRRRFQRFADVFMTGSARIYTPVSLLLAVAIAVPFYLQWEQALLFFFGSASGIVDPVYGNDVSFYMFSYPIYMLVQKELLTTAVIVFLATGVLYWMEHVFVPNQSKEFPFGAKIHLTVLFTFVVLFVIWGFLLDRFSLLYEGGNEPVFFGPGFVDMRYKLPLIWLEVLFFLAIAVSVVFYAFSERHRSKALIIVATLGFFAVWGLRGSHTVPEMIEKFIVKPNFTRTESDSMRMNIDATMAAFDLNNIKVVDFKVSLDATKDIEAWSTKKHFENIPVWDREFLIDGYMQLQGLRPYYGFPTVDEDRYFINGHHQQVNLAAREVNIDKLPKEAQNWENTHLRYTHGYGAVISPAAQDAGIPIVWYLRDLNMTSDVGFSVKYPDIYYGLEKYRYAIVPNNLVVRDISSSAPEESLDYQGNSGIPIPSLFRKMLFAFYLKDEKIFFAPNITTQSKVLLRRNIDERISTLTPFLHLDKDPYLVVGKDRFYWIQDAYTLSNFYPVSKPAADDYLDGEHKFNYIRNSVKIVVDAYDGRVDYYISDPKDPIINAYNRAYPGVFKNVREMPDELLEHLRYPRDLYYMQMKIYAKYHQNSPELFYEQAETWQFASVDGLPVLPYFITMDFDRCNDLEEFVMINPMTPVHRENLSMVGVAGTVDENSCDHSYKPGITIYKFPKAVQVNGPSQVNALIDQNPEIAAQFTLWNQQGSEVKKGRMVILTMGNSILYVQPIYMLATKTKIPELARVIVSIGNQVVMDKTLQAAFGRLKDLFIKGANGSVSGISSTESK
ncbi:hypothetical protein [Methylomonas albis]|uniref:UPF0182 family protein n=1 Tax=Methylomonas albis TaxID=1854563 RepID=A0ABR9D5S9_9GAMM|nr:UPF0182 family protein [Methylomonas albis]MBD9358490.1 UPF0182 family protein [Methylomonas albis]CAD6881902.1 hypothetical protein [Methylomonas albis]